MNFQIIDLKEKLFAAFIVALNSDFCRGAAARAPSAPRYVSRERASGCNYRRLLAGRPRTCSVDAALTLCVGVAIAARAGGRLDSNINVSIMSMQDQIWSNYYKKYASGVKNICNNMSYN